MSEPPEAIIRYARSHGLQVSHRLGEGHEGTVWTTSRMSAVKRLQSPPHYRKERDVYLRLLKHAVTEVAGFHVPALIDFEDCLLVIEMEVVQPPYVLDFAGAYLDESPPFEPEQIAEWQAACAEVFETDWPRVRRAYYAFQRYGTTLNDLHPRNIACR